MATAPRMSNVAAIAALDAITGLFDAGSYIEIRTGSIPATLETSATGTLLGTLTLDDPAFGAAIDADPGAMATAGDITGDTTADDTGTAGYFRAYDSSDTPIIQGTCGTATADLVMNTVSIVGGLPIDITSWVIKLPEAAGEAPGDG